jgi:CRP-like cAMP-binding protein
MKGPQLVELSDRMTSMSFAKGETLMAVGDPADYLYLLLRGSVGVYNDHNVLVDEITRGNVVGESAIQNKTLRTASVKAHENTQVLKLAYEDFDAMAFQMKLRDFYDVASFLGTIAFFSEWSLSKLYRLASVSIIKQCQKGQVVFRKGEFARDLYIVKEGEIHMNVELDLEQVNQWPTANHQWACVHTTRRYRQTVRSCLSGDIFGERELIDGASLSTTAVCASTAIICIIRQQFFAEIFSSKDRQRLYRLTERPITKELRFALAFEQKKAKTMSSALLNAMNTNPLPAGRSLFALHGSERKQDWARKLVKRQKLKERSGVVKQTQMLETIRSDAQSP